MLKEGLLTQASQRYPSYDTIPLNLSENGTTNFDKKIYIIVFSIFFIMFSIFTKLSLPLIRL
jgi:hypothetical protein